ncbi:cell division protein FtsQ/DivIB [Paenirhodobacter sp.]|uniref:cell division protein FtsQ/DivIB n=1 Tax=Paenirhodobacter sp. TaxID=1965326 RepID=UPI003B4053EA
MRPLSAQPRYLKPRGPKRDPAPSRLAFRLQRLWLTPTVRALTRIGAPIFVVVLGLGLWLGDAGRRADLVQWYDDLKLQIQNRPEFRVADLKIEGASPEVEDAVRAMLPVELPASRFAIDLTAYHDAIKRLDAVKDVALIVRNDALDIKVTEREPVILWRTQSTVEMLDETGHRTASLVRRDARPDLPLIAGEGADKAVPEALEVLAAARPLLPKMRGLIRVGERRWDIALDGERAIMLPEKNPARAVEKVLALDGSDDLLSRDFSRVDLRNPDRPTVRLSSYALEQFQVITGQIPAPRKTNAKASP